MLIKHLRTANCTVLLIFIYNDGKYFQNLAILNSVHSPTNNLIPKSPYHLHEELEPILYKEFPLQIIKDSGGLLVRVSGYRSRGPGFDFRRFQIF
jgi:hypothetical protein